MRPTSLAAAAALAALVLSACSPAATPSPSASPSTSPSTTASPSASPSASVTVSNNLDAISVKGAYGVKPTIAVKAPFAIDETRVKVLHEGTGTTIPTDGVVDAYYLGTDGRTGKVFDQNFDAKTGAVFPLANVVPGFAKGLAGQRVGSRVLIAMPGSDGYDAAGGQASAGIEVGDTLIFVVDIVSGSVAGPTGKAIAPAAGLPAVTETDGKPTIAIPTGNPPTSLQVQPLTAGTGAKVAAGDSIVARYVGVSWKTGKVIDDQFATPSSGALADTIPGWKKGLVGKRIGQRVLLVLPPAEGFPQGSNNPPVEAGDTVVYVVDILFAASQG